MTPNVSSSFVTADLTESGAVIQQFTDGQAVATIHLEHAQIQFVIDQLIPYRSQA